jgi:transcriptional regulator with XRE-family HTH domain
MNLAENIKTIREDKNLKQIEVATHIGVDKSAYSKIEKGLRALTVDELQKMSQLFNLTTDQIINYDGNKVPTEVVIEDKTAVEQIRLS